MPQAEGEVDEDGRSEALGWGGLQRVIHVRDDEGQSNDGNESQDVGPGVAQMHIGSVQQGHAEEAPANLGGGRMTVREELEDQESDKEDVDDGPRVEPVWCRAEVCPTVKSLAGTAESGEPERTHKTLCRGGQVRRWRRDLIQRGRSLITGHKRRGPSREQKISQGLLTSA